MSETEYHEAGEQLWHRVRIPLVIGILAVVPFLFFDEGATFRSQLILLILSFTILGMALNIVFGHTDQLYLFIGALVGISAYTTAYTATEFEISPWVTILFGAGLVAAIGSIVSYVAARRRFTIMLIAILTLALQLAGEQIFVGASDYTGGSTGFRPYPELALPSIQESFGLHRHVVLWYILLALFIGVILLYHYLMNSKYGVAFEVIREDEIAAESVGVNVVQYKTLAGFIAAAIIGFVGPLYAQAAGAWTVASPGLFSFLSVDVVLLILLVVGGLRTMLGPIVGAAVIIWIDHRLQGFGEWRLMIFGLLLIFLFLYFRQGIVPFIDEKLKQYFDVKAKVGEWYLERSR